MKIKLIGASALALVLSAALSEAHASFSLNELEAIASGTPTGFKKLAEQVVASGQTLDEFAEDYEQADQGLGGGNPNQDVQDIQDILGGGNDTILNKVTAYQQIISVNDDIRDGLANVRALTGPLNGGNGDLVSTLAAFIATARLKINAIEGNAPNLNGGNYPAFVAADPANPTLQEIITWLNGLN